MHCSQRLPVSRHPDAAREVVAGSIRFCGHEISSAAKPPNPQHSGARNAPPPSVGPPLTSTRGMRSPRRLSGIILHGKSPAMGPSLKKEKGVAVRLLAQSRCHPRVGRPGACANFANTHDASRSIHFCQGRLQHRKAVPVRRG